MTKEYLNNPDLPFDFEEMGKGFRRQQEKGIDVQSKLQELKDILGNPKKSNRKLK